MSDISFDEHLKKMTKRLENSPDPWFRKPRGWLKKPDFKRTAQLNSSVGVPVPPRRPSLMDAISLPMYQQRWFRLDLKQRVLYYYKDDSVGTSESGRVDMKSILDIQPSKVFDAPEFSLDLIGAERRYTIVAHTNTAMIRWALALNLAMAQVKESQNMRSSIAYLMPSQGSQKLISAGRAPEQSSVTDDPNFTHFDVHFEECGPLMMNIMGTYRLNKTTGKSQLSIVVTSFPPADDGSPSRAEMTGKIRFRDIVTGVNDKNFDNLSFNQSIAIIHQASWPKTLHFKRSDENDRTQLESWSFIHYPSLHTKRRRYVELRWDALNFRKPAPGGAAVESRDAYFTLNQIEQLRPVFDKSMPPNQQYILQLVCKPGSVVDYVGENDESIGGTPVEVLELCFSKHHTMNAWRSALITPPTEGRDSSIGEMVPVLPMETIEAVEAITGYVSIGVKSNLTGRFAPREVSLVAGVLKWKRVPSVGKVKTSKARTMLIANTSSCELQSVRAFLSPKPDHGMFRYQIVLNTKEHQSVTLGMGDEQTLEAWLLSLRDTVALAPEDARKGVTVPLCIEESEYAEALQLDAAASSSARTSCASGGPRTLAVTETDKEGDDDEDFDVGNEMEDFQARMAGYLFKKTDTLGFIDYKRRWFVLEENAMYYCQSRAEATSRMLYALGSIDIRDMVEVRDALDKYAPENAFEIVTPWRTYTLVAEDEAQQLMWLDALGDTLESRIEAVRLTRRRGSVSDAMGSVLPRDTIIARQESVLHRGQMVKLTGNRLTGINTWKKRYFVISMGSLLYFKTEEDLLDPEAACLGEVSLNAITLIRSSVYPGTIAATTLDLHARVARGGDTNGMRVYTFVCASAADCNAWMEALCRAAGTMKMQVDTTGSSGGLISVPDTEKMRQARAKRSKSMFVSSSSSPNALSTPLSSTSSPVPSPSPSSMVPTRPLHHMEMESAQGGEQSVSDRVMKQTSNPTLMNPMFLLTPQSSKSRLAKVGSTTGPAGRGGTGTTGGGRVDGKNESELFTVSRPTENFPSISNFYDDGAL